MSDNTFHSLTEYLSKIPAVQPMSTGFHENGLWWLKLRIDINHPLAWSVVQELGCVINYISLDKRLPTKFYPVSPAPYLNGGPAEFLSWVIENTDKEFGPAILMEWLEGRLPRPVDQLSEWSTE